MEEKWEIEWAEMRNLHETTELFFVAAAEDGSAWSFLERSRCQLESHPVRKLQHMLIAQYLKEAIVNQCPDPSGIAYLVLWRCLDRCEFLLCPSVNERLAQYRDVGDLTIVAEFKLRAYRHIDLAANNCPDKIAA